MLLDKTEILKWFAPVVLVVLLNGCGGSSSPSDTEQNSSDSNITQSPIQSSREENNTSQESQPTVVAEEEQYTLTFIDSPVVNLTYECGDKIAQTDSEGNLTCASFPITFSAIGIEIGELEAMTDDHRVFPEDLVGVDRLSTSNSEVQKIASFLQSLDDDGDVSHYIIIMDNNITQSKQQKQTIQKRNLRRLADMSSSDMFALLRSRGFRPISLHQAEQNLRQYGLGLAPTSSYTPPSYTPPTPTPDTTPPVVTLNGDANLSLFLNQAYSELNATATDNIDGNVSASITITGSVDTSTVGVYILTYTARDSSGNEGNTTRGITLSGVRKTGQTISYDAIGNVVADGTQKDDGYYQKGATPSFTRDDTKEIVTDNLTGLMWQDNSAVASIRKGWLSEDNFIICDSNNYSDPACFDTTGDTSTTYCANLELGGYEDWRLPKIEELDQLLNYEKSSPALDIVFQNISYQLENESTYGYGSSSTVRNIEFVIWRVDFTSGITYFGEEFGTPYIRCVRESVNL